MPDTLKIGRNWHEAYLLMLSVLYGVGGLVSGQSSKAIDATFPAWGALGWYIGLITGAALGLAGIILETSSVDQEPPPPTMLVKRLRRWRTGLILERSSMRLLVGLCTAYVLGALATSSITQVTAAFGASLVAAFALANFARARQISRRLPKVEAALRVLADPGAAS